MRLNLINRIKKIFLLSIILLVTACGKTDFSGSWTIDIKDLKDNKDYQSADEDGKKLMEGILQSVYYLIDGNKVSLEGKLIDKSTICEIKEFDRDTGVVCPDGNNFGLFIKGSNLFVKTKDGDLIPLVKLQVEKKVGEANSPTPPVQVVTPNTPPIIGEFVESNQGDTSCGLSILDSNKKQIDLSATFNICDDTNIKKGSVYKFTYTVLEIDDCDCQGNDDCQLKCKKKSRVELIDSAVLVK
jgi:hypothetical protein